MNLGPVLLKELRSQMRGRRAVFALTAYLGVLLLVALAIYAIASVMSEGLEVAETSESIGTGLFTSLSVLQASLVVLLTPAFTANAISQEREQKTLDVLSVTLLEPWAIVVGKLLAALAYIGMVLVASLPVVAMGFLFGGVEPAQVAAVFGVQMLLALTFGALGLFFSSFVRRTLWSMVFSYVTIFTMVAVLPIVDIAIGAVTDASRFTPFFLYLNPLPLALSAANRDFAAEVAGETVPFTVLTPLMYAGLAVVLLVCAAHFVGSASGVRRRVHLPAGLRLRARAWGRGRL